MALERRPARVFIHVPNDEIYDCLVRLRDAFKDADKAAVRFPAVRKFQGYANSNQELRFFHEEDEPRAKQIANLFGTLGLELAVKDISKTSWARTNAPNSYELWFTGKPLPRICRRGGAEPVEPRLNGAVGMSHWCVRVVPVLTVQQNGLRFAPAASSSYLRSEG